jgi:N-acetylglucosaminyldiphosphoundecaprenol N-acetyl-beta-D-mannosaminyltransferase
LNSQAVVPYSSSDSTFKTDRVNVLGVGISAINMQDAVDRCHDLISSDGKGYVCVTGVHGVTEAQHDPKFREILNKSFLTTPDGMPMVWVGRVRGFGRIERVYGPDFMWELCRQSVERGQTHFLYGGKEGTADCLGQVLKTAFPGIQIVGTYTPPFRPLTNDEKVSLKTRIREVHPDVMWVGLSTPKQERFMAEYLGQLEVKLMIGVGAAFDIHTGQVKDAPSLMKSVGLQWLHRLWQEPKRLWRRYLINNPLFVWRICMQFLGIRRYAIE